MPQPAKSSQALARTRRAFPLVLGACLVAFTCTASGSSAPPVPCNNPGVICGTAGPDTLTGTNGDDFIYGLGGDDTIHGLAGGDELYGGEGDDTVYGDEGGSSIDAGPGNDRVFGGPSYDDAFGGAGDDKVFGGGSSDSVGGADGDDQVSGGPGRDLVEGDDGNDQLSGGSGPDAVMGGHGNDRLSGGPGNDHLAEDAHQVGFGFGKDSFAAGPGRDEVVSRDGVRERVDCGSGIDKVLADKRDRLMGCERVCTTRLCPQFARRLPTSSEVAGTPRRYTAAASPSKRQCSTRVRMSRRAAAIRAMQERHLRAVSGGNLPAPASPSRRPGFR